MVEFTISVKTSAFVRHFVHLATPLFDFSSTPSGMKRLALPYHCLHVLWNYTKQQIVFNSVILKIEHFFCSYGTIHAYVWIIRFCTFSRISSSYRFICTVWNLEEWKVLNRSKWYIWIIPYHQQIMQVSLNVKSFHAWVSKKSLKQYLISLLFRNIQG